MQKVGILEGLLFVVGDEGLTIENICNVLEIDELEAKKLLKELKEKYEQENSGLKISYLADTFKLTTKPEHKEYLSRLVKTEEANTLSPMQLETLAIIAYNGPITRIEVDEIRGVASSYTIRKLLAKGLIKPEGKSDLPGKPNLYVVTKEFLDYFGLASITDLPKIEAPESKQDDGDLYTTIFKEN